MFARPQTIDEAVTILSADTWTILAGGTDFYPGLRDQAVSGPTLDISALEELRGIEQSDDAWHIGALCTWSELIRTPLPAAFDALKLAAREVGSVQVQNRATLAGNLCNASPAADGVPALLVLAARVELTSSSGTRTLTLADFITGNRKTARRSDEILTRIIVPRASAAGRSHFLKFGARKYLVISIAMVAARIETDDNNLIRQAAVAVGACSQVAMRLNRLEQALHGLPLEADIASVVSGEHLQDLSPIDDVRASASYRRNAAHELVRRALVGCASQRGA
jgi:CO/xanthine dehydrogenase FAD-binding subunit